MGNQNRKGIASLAIVAVLMAAIFASTMAYACPAMANSQGSCGCLKDSNGSCGCGNSCSCNSNGSDSCSCGKADCSCGCKQGIACTCGKTSQITGNAVKAQSGFDSFLSFIKSLFGAK